MDGYFRYDDIDHIVDASPVYRVVNARSLDVLPKAVMQILMERVLMKLPI